MLYIVLIIKKNTIYCAPVVDMKILGWHCSCTAMLHLLVKTRKLLVPQQLQKQHQLS